MRLSNKYPIRSDYAYQSSPHWATNPYDFYFRNKMSIRGFTAILMTINAKSINMW